MTPWLTVLVAAMAAAGAPDAGPGSASSAELPDEGTVVFLGDSITWQNHWCALIEAQVRSREPERRLVFVNRGLRGDTAAGAVARYRRDVAPLRPDVVYVMVGMNDGGYRGVSTHRLRLYQDNLERLVQLVRGRAGARVVLLTPTAVRPRNHDLRRYNRMLATMAEGAVALGARLGVPVIDLFPSFEAALEASADGGTEDLMEDDIHPGRQGHLLIARRLLAHLDPGHPLGEGPATPASRRVHLALSQRFRWSYVLWDPEAEGAASAARAVGITEPGVTAEVARRRLAEAEVELRRALPEARGE
ncbi:MAG: SGNH/GDSL hydrolase family protein [Myxococcales bacterium]|nr:SGNH/GDSL hydrolase family protein [Myxococcales bacterium]